VVARQVEKTARKILAAAAILLAAVLFWSAADGKTVYKFVNRSFLQPGEVRVLADDDYYPAILDLIDTAQQEIRMVMFLFKMNEKRNNRPARIVEALIRARKRGVRVEVLLETSDHDDDLDKENRRVGRRLKQNGVKVFYDTRKTTTHAKLLVVDRRRVLVGSHNLTQAALKYNHELSLLIDNERLAEQLIRYIDRLPHRR